jgi:hypothetical protein
MRLIRLILATILALGIAAQAGCDKKSKTRPLVTTQAVQICLDDTTLIRQEDERCEEGLNTFRWVYVFDDPAWPAELPAVGEYIQGGRFTPVQPLGVTIGRVPREGGTFPVP